MEKMTIAKLAVSAVLLVLAVIFASGILGGKEVTYQIPGPYSAESTNQFSTVKVDMTVQGDQITDCVIASSGDSDLMNDEIRAEWAQAIVEAQSADTDVITGATLTYSAASVREAVNDCLVQAGLREASAEPEPEAEPEPAEDEPADTEPEAETGALADGTYTVEKNTDFSTITTQITVEGGAITGANVSSEGANDLLTDENRSAWAQQIVEKQDVDAISGVTISSNAVKEAVGELLAQAAGGASGGTSAEDEARIAELEAKIAELESAASEAEARADEAEAKVAELEAAAAAVTVEAASEATGDASAYMRARPAAATEEQPAEETASEASGDASAYMRARPAAEEQPAVENASEASGDASAYMRARPAAATEQPAGEPASEATGDASAYMRARPAAATEQPAGEPASEATGDASAYMRARPAAAADEQPAGETASEASGDASAYMRARPAAAEEQPVEKSASAASGDASAYMRARPAAAEEETAQEEPAEEAEPDQSADISSALGYIVTSMGDNKENSYVTDYLEQDPYLVNIYEGYGFAKDYGSARGHEYTLEDVAKTQRPHPKANCLTCKTPDFHKLVAQEGVGVYSMAFDDVMAQMTVNVSCYTCHGDDLGNGGALVVTHQYVNEALGENVSAINAATLSCGQCHIEYYFTPSDSETMMPYHDVAGMAPEAILAYYDELGFADWTQESTGTRMLKAQHPEMETFLQGKHAAFLSCADCHMAPETTPDGVAYHSHLLVSPLESEALLETCARCHGDTDMVAFVHGIQENVTARETEVGNKLSGMKDKLAEAAASGKWSEEDLNAVRKLHREAQWFFDYCYVENSEGAHNSQLSLRCLETSEAKIDEALALLEAAEL